VSVFYRPRISIGLEVDVPRTRAYGVPDRVTHAEDPRIFDVSGGRNVFTRLQVPIGLDGDIRLRRHLSLVPQIRFYFDPLGFLNDGCCGGTQSRVRLAMRWRF